MGIIEIAPLENGAHRNQTGNFSVVPSGWAIIPHGMVCENFPFGEVAVEEVNGVMTVIEWSPLPVPEPEPEPIPEPTEMEQLRADVDFIAMEMGVEL